MARRNKTVEPLEWLKKMAEVLDQPEFLDGTSPLQRRGYRAAADELGQAIADLSQHELTATDIMTFLQGATFQAEVGSGFGGLLGQIVGGVQQNKVNTTIVLCLGYLARDLLAGERVMDA